MKKMTIKQWIKNEIKDMDEQLLKTEGTENSFCTETELLNNWKKYEKELAKIIKLKYNNDACWNNIEKVYQIKIAEEILEELIRENNE